MSFNILCVKKLNMFCLIFRISSFPKSGLKFIEFCFICKKALKNYSYEYTVFLKRIQKDKKEINYGREPKFFVTYKYQPGNPC